MIFKLISVTDGCDIWSEIVLKWTSLGLRDDKSTLVQVMAWCHQVTSHYLNQCWPRSLPPYGVTRPQWVNSSLRSAAYMPQWTGPASVKVMACRLFSAKPLPEPMLAYCQLDCWEQISLRCKSKIYHFHSTKCIWNCRLPKWRPFCPGGDELTHQILRYFFFELLSDITFIHIKRYCLKLLWHDMY